MNMFKIAGFGVILFVAFMAIEGFIAAETIVGKTVFPSETIRCDTLYHPSGVSEQFCGGRYARRSIHR